jgi:hypothetical protein
VDWVAIERANVCFFLIVEDNVTPEGAGTHDVAIGQDISVFCVVLASTNQVATYWHT